MARQTYLSSNQFIKMAECTISEQEYIELLKQKNIIKRLLMRMIIQPLKQR